MLRRTFLAAAAAASTQPAFAMTGSAYKEGLVDRELAAGMTVFIDFYTDWCTTCRAQDRVISKLKAGNPDYEKHISFVAVDWDLYSRSDLAKRLNIPRRSTLVVLKGKKELGRIVAGTRPEDIKALLDLALGAAIETS